MGNRSVISLRQISFHDPRIVRDSLGSGACDIQATRFHRIVQPIELSLLALAAAVIDVVRGDLAATRVLVVACVVAAGLQVVLHLVSILASRRLA